MISFSYERPAKNKIQYNGGKLEDKLMPWKEDLKLDKKFDFGNGENIATLKKMKKKPN